MEQKVGSTAEVLPKTRSNRLNRPTLTQEYLSSETELLKSREFVGNSGTFHVH